MIAALCARIVMLAIFGLLALAASASAECAWVLWNEVTYYGLDSPSASLYLVGAFPGFEQCEQSRVAKARSLRQVTESDRSGPNVARVTTEENGNVVTKATHLKDGRNLTTSYRLNCLPDTVNPRGANQ